MGKDSGAGMGKDSGAGMGKDSGAGIVAHIASFLSNVKF